MKALGGGHQDWTAAHVEGVKALTVVKRSEAAGARSQRDGHCFIYLLRAAVPRNMTFWLEIVPLIYGGTPVKFHPFARSWLQQPTVGMGREAGERQGQSVPCPPLGSLAAALLGEGAERQASVRDRVSPAPPFGSLAAALLGEWAERQASVRDRVSPAPPFGSLAAALGELRCGDVGQ